LAILSICCADFTTVTLATGDDIPTGSEIIVMGYPLGIAGLATVSRGIVSAVRYESDTDRWVVQTDASINPGNSGGPMLAMSGEFVGIATYKIIASRGGIAVEGVGFAVSDKTLREQLPILSSGQVSVKLKPLAPTATPPPRRFKLSLNGTEISEDSSLVILGGGSVKVVPTPDFDGAYPAGTVVNLWVYNNNPRSGASFRGVDNLDPKGVASVIMYSDRAVEIFFY
jgi:S1-C subfamily serine protease